MDNLRGAALMTLAMLGFAIEDMFIKLLSDRLPIGQILLSAGIGGALVFSLLALIRREPPFLLSMFWGPSGLRVLFEGIAGLCFMTALALAPLSVVTTIIQANPLLVTLGAALFLREPVGPWRWSAIVIGLFGVLIVLRPFGAAFETTALFAVGGVIAMSARDLVTRRLPARFSTVQMSVVGFLAVVPGGLIALAVTGDRPVAMDGPDWLLLAGILGTGVPALYCIIAAMRIGEISFVAPFRYSRIVFGLTLGAVVFSETIDGPMIVGVIIIVSSGLFTLWRERKHRRMA
jgi:drug/metabolite transporter (DMT)-like permease